MTISNYYSYLKFSKPVLVNYLKSINVNMEFKTIQSAASYCNKNHTDNLLNNLYKFSRRYLAENFSSLSLPEMKAFFRFSKFTNFKINSEEDILKNAKFMMKRSNLELRKNQEIKYRKQYEKFDLKNKQNEPLKPVSENFLKNVKVIDDNNKLHIGVYLNGSSEMVENMINFVYNNILRFMNFSEELKVTYKFHQNDFVHYEHFNADNIKYLFEKFSNKN